MFNLKSITSPIDSSNLSFKTENFFSSPNANSQKIQKEKRVPFKPKINTISLPDISATSNHNSLYFNSFTILSKKTYTKQPETILPTIDQKINKHIHSIIKNYPSIYLRRQINSTFPKVKTNYLTNININKKLIIKNDTKSKKLNKFQFDSIYYGNLSKEF